MKLREDEEQQDRWEERDRHPGECQALVRRVEGGEPRQGKLDRE